MTAIEITQSLCRPDPKLMVEQLKELGVDSRRRDRHSAAPPSTFSRCLNKGRERMSVKWQSRRWLRVPRLRPIIGGGSGGSTLLHAGIVEVGPEQRSAVHLAVGEHLS